MSSRGCCERCSLLPRSPRYLPALRCVPGGTAATPSQTCFAFARMTCASSPNRRLYSAWIDTRYDLPRIQVSPEPYQPDGWSHHWSLITQSTLELEAIGRQTLTPLEAAVDLHFFSEEFRDKLSTVPSTTRQHSLRVPFNLLVAITGHLPLIAVWRWAKRARKRSTARRTGHCTQCGYDLRATRDRCPECGAAVERIHAAA